MQSLCCKFSTTCVVATNTPYAILVRIYTKGNRDDYEKTVMGNGMKRHCQYVRLNAENRLVRAQELYAPTNRAPYTVTYAYDHRGRMVSKRITENDGSNSPISILHSTFVWDDWNIIRESVRNGDGSATVTDNAWGLDLDGTLQGAGGVGGLLAVVRSDCVTTNSSTPNSSTPQLFFPTYDANGNVSEYVSTNGEVVAHYDYSPFGEILVQSGYLADTFTHRFSTKPWCQVTGLYEYQMRKYRPEIGRWMSRDPLDDSSCLNYFCLLSNNPVISVDYLGMAHLKNMTSSMLLTLGNVPISDSCRRYLMEQIDNLFLGKNGLNGVLFLIGVGESSTHNSKISDIDGYWTTLSPGLPGHAEKNTTLPYYNGLGFVRKDWRHIFVFVFKQYSSNTVDRQYAERAIFGNNIAWQRKVQMFR